jgi:hypothetical protein
MPTPTLTAAQKKELLQVAAFIMASGRFSFSQALEQAQLLMAAIEALP